MAECLRTLIFSALTSVGLSLARVICETSQALLAGGQVFFSGISHFCPTLRLTRLKMREIILTGHKTQIKRKKKIYKKFRHLKLAVIILNLEV